MIIDYSIKFLDESSYVKKVHVANHNWSRFYFWTAAFATMIYATLPPIYFSVVYYVTGENNRSTPVPMKFEIAFMNFYTYVTSSIYFRQFPLMFISPFYEILTVIIFITNCTTIWFGFACMDNLYCAMAVYLRAHLQYLGAEYRELGKENQRNRSQYQLINYHREILKLCADFSDLFGLLVLIQLVMATFMLCFTGHILVKVIKFLFRAIGAHKFIIWIFNFRV